MSEETESLLYGLIEFESNLFSINGIKNYLLMFLRNPLTALACGFVGAGWKMWQDKDTNNALYGFIATVIVFMAVMIFSNYKAVTIFKETKKLKKELEDMRLEVSDKNIEISNANAQRILSVDKHEFIMNHLKRNINLLNGEIQDEITYLIKICKGIEYKDQPALFEKILIATGEKMQTKVDRIDANADAIHIDPDLIRDKMMTGELKAIPSPQQIMRKETIHKLNHIKDATAIEAVDSEAEEKVPPQRPEPTLT